MQQQKVMQFHPVETTQAPVTTVTFDRCGVRGYGPTWFQGPVNTCLCCQRSKLQWAYKKASPVPPLNSQLQCPQKSQQKCLHIIIFVGVQEPAPPPFSQLQGPCLIPFIVYQAQLLKFACAYASLQSANQQVTASQTSNDLILMVYTKAGLSISKSLTTPLRSNLL